MSVTELCERVCECVWGRVCVVVCMREQCACACERECV